MNIELQKKIIEETKAFRYKHNYATYPPYHEGPYLEEYFFNFFEDHIKEFSKGERYYLPILWTDYYIAEKHKDGALQQYLNSLDKNLKYFTITQHDDGIKENYDVDILHYAASHSRTGKRGDTWIPVVCSSIKNISPLRKNIFASFVGSGTGQRRIMFEGLRNNPKYFIKLKGWEPVIRKEEEELFMNYMNKSIFSLCPRGYGATSFRLYEAMQFGSIPVYISDIHLFPWEDELNWSEFCVIIKYNEWHKINEILSQYSLEKITKMQNKIKEVYQPYFTLEGMCKNILKRI